MIKKKLTTISSQSSGGDVSGGRRRGPLPAGLTDGRRTQYADTSVTLVHRAGNPL